MKIILKIDWSYRYFIYLTCDLYMKKLLYITESNRLPGDAYTWESIVYTNNSTNIQLNLKFRHDYWDQEKFFDETKKETKISWHCLFKTN
jgi:hypothetical protein